ncbi:MAG: leucine-rich repeat protein, partial [Acutalibacteraceae bacterium]|nr:leucine-rich repeat protein [Acutalibacteraceae bacterium]
GSNLTLIDGYAFQNCDSLKTVNIKGGNNATIDYYAFYSCDNLESVTIDNGVKTIGSYAFEYCGKLKEVKIGNTVTSIGYCAFYGCHSLTDLSLGSSVETIREGAFQDCNALEEVTIPNSVKTINNNAFANNESLKNVTIGSGCTSIHANAFAGDTALESITVSADNTTYSSVDGTLLNKDKTAILLYPKARSGAYTIPDSITSLGDSTFSDCKNLTEIVIGKGITEISKNAFSGCTALTKVVIGDNVTTIGSSAFVNCTALEKVVISDSVKTIGESAFSQCAKITQVTFGKNVTSIGGYAFYNNKALTKVDLSKCTGLTTIGSYAFESNYALTTLNLPDSLQTIGSWAFYNCGNLTALEIGSNLTLIDGYAFQNCDSLKTVNIKGGNNATIDYSAFYSCNNLESVTIGNGVKTIGSDVFKYCDKLKEVKIGDDITYVGTYAFYGCNALTTIQILGKELTSVSNSSFQNNETCTIYCCENSNTYKKLVELGYTNIKYLEENFYVRDLSVAQLSSASATLNWNKPYGHDNIDYYIVYKNDEKLIETNKTSYTATGLKANEEYTFAVTAVNNENIESEKVEIKVTPACSSVESITVPNSNNIGGLIRVKLSAKMSDALSNNGGKGVFMYAYDASVEGEELEENSWLGITDWYYACDTTLNSSSDTYVGYWDLTDVPTANYYLKFLFTDRDGGTSTYYDKVTVDRTHPQKIDELMVIPAEHNIKLAWQMSKEISTNIYRVYRKTSDSSKFELITEIHNRDTVSYVDKNVEKGVTYSYFVVGVDEYSQESLTYDIVTAGLIDDAIAPSFIKMTPANSSYIYGNMRFTVNSSDNVGVTKTELYYSYTYDSDISTWTLLGGYNGSTMSKEVDTTVIKNGVVYIKAKIYDAVGNFTYSPAYQYMCDNQGPEKVTGFKCIKKYGANLTLEWSDVSDNDIMYYKVECLQEDGTYKEIQKSYSKLGANISGLTPETEYTFRVVGYDKFDNRGVESDLLKVKTTADEQSPVVTRFGPNSDYYNGTIPLQITAEDDYQVKSLKIETSRNKSKWEEVTTIELEVPEKTHTFNYNLYTTKFEEGSLYVRAIVKDTYGNETEADDITCYEYEIDRTPAKLPSEFTASSDENYVSLQWSPITNDDSFHSYNLYRSEVKDGEFPLLKSGLQTITAYDTDVVMGKYYYYKISTVDKAGNESELSETIVCKVKEDEEAPVIYDIYPKDGSVIGVQNKNITVLATDNAKVYNMKVEYRVEGLFNSYKTLKEIKANPLANCQTTVDLPLDDIANGATVTIKATASDQAGNLAKMVTASYTVDKTAPTVNDLTVTQGENKNFTLNWKSDGNGDTKYYYIYRQFNNEGKYTIYDTVVTTDGQTEYRYTDDDIANTDTAIQYKVEAYDMVGNSSSVESEVFTLEVDTSPVASLSCKHTVITEREYVYDASGSTDNGKIVEYKFDFGNGDVIKSKTPQATYAYTKIGTYKLTLTVTDDEGKTSTVEKEVVVSSVELFSDVTIRVLDNNASPIDNAPVYVDLGETGEQKAYTNENGLVTFQVPIGTHTFASYKENYLPVSEKMTISSEKIYTELVLVKEPIVTGTYEIHKMTFEEIVAAGIDINAAENRNVLRFDVTLRYEDQPVFTAVYVNGNGMIIPEPIEIVDKYGEKRLLVPAGLANCRGGADAMEDDPPKDNGNNTQRKNPKPAIVFIDVPVGASSVKDFFDVSLHIVNHASEEFSLLDNTVTLNVPDGLTVMETECSEPSAKVTIPEIKGQSQKSIKWILRGDKAGTYNISADFLGTLSQFNEPVRATFATKEPIKVEDASSLKVTVETSKSTYAGAIFYNIVVENRGVNEIYDYRWDNLIEPFGMEYVDAKGEKYVMPTQRTVLKPREKFVYHYYDDRNEDLFYIETLVKDLTSSGAWVSVNEYNATDFVDFYMQMFPEEAESSFYLTVKDGKGSPVPGANVQIGKLKLTTDNRGRVTIKDRTIPGGTLKVSKAGYYDYIQNDYCAFALSKSDTVILSKKGTFSIQGIYFDNTNVLNTKKRIYKDDDDGEVMVTVKAYGNVKDVRIIQNGEPVGSYGGNQGGNSGGNQGGNSGGNQGGDSGGNQGGDSGGNQGGDSGGNQGGDSGDGSNTLGEYDVPVPIDKLKEGEPIEVEVDAINEAGEEVTKKEKVKTEVKESMSLTANFPDFKDVNITLSSDITDGEVDWFANVEISIKKDDSTEVKLSYDFNNDVILCEFTKSYGNDEEEAKDTEWVSSFTIEGKVEIKMDDKDNYRTNGNLHFQLVLRTPEFTKTFYPYGVPVTVGVQFKADTNSEIGLEYNISKNSFESTVADLKIDGEIALTAGVGFAYCSAGLYGKLYPHFYLDLKEEDIVRYITFSGEIGLYLKIRGIWRHYWKLWAPTGEARIYPWDDQKKTKELSQAVASIYDTNVYSINEKLLDYNAIWDNPILANSGTTTLIENTNAYLAPQIITCGDDTIMVYAGVDKTSPSMVNAITLYCSVYNKETGKWGVPTKIDNNNQLDTSYSLCTDGEKIYLVYAQANKVYDENVTLDDMNECDEIYTAVFDSSANKFTNFTQLTNNSTYDCNPIVKTVNGVPTAVWVNNANSNLFLTDAENTIMISTCENGVWSQPKA